MQLAYFDIANPSRLYVLPKRNSHAPLFSTRGTDYVQLFFQQIRDLGNIGIVTIKGTRVIRRAVRKL
jgi:hypothetical protein